MLTHNDIHQVLLPLIDAGIRSAGVQLFQNDGGARLQEVLAKLALMADEARKPAGATQEQTA